MAGAFFMPPFQEPSSGSLTPHHSTTLPAVPSTPSPAAAGDLHSPGGTGASCRGSSPGPAAAPQPAGRWMRYPAARRRGIQPNATAGDKGGGDAAGTIGPVAGGKPGCSKRPQSRGSAGVGLCGGGGRRRGWGAHGRGVARATHRLLVSESRSRGAEGVGYQSGPLASCAASPLQFAT
jgi:hypothetical protein